MRISVGIDIAKEIHWVTAIDADGIVRIDRKLLNTPSDIAALADELTALHGTVRIGLDVIGGIAGLAEAMLAQAGFALVHVPGIAVNRARQGTVGGENKSDPRDARTIADQVRTRADLRRIEPATEIDLEIRLLVSRRGDLVQAQTQRLSRMHDLLVGIFPGLEACLDLKTSATWRSDCEAAGGGATGGGPLHLLTRYVTHSELRAAGKKRLVRHLQAGGGLPNVDALAERALAAAAEQTIVAPAERMTARLIRELAAEALVSRARLVELDRELEALLGRHHRHLAIRLQSSRWRSHRRDAALIRSLPGMGVVLTAELIAEAGNLPASGPPMHSPRPPAWRRRCASPAGRASCVGRTAATRALSVCSTSPRSARSTTTTAAPSTTANDARGNATTKPSSPSHDAASTCSGLSFIPGRPFNPASKQLLD